MGDLLEVIHLLEVKLKNILSNYDSLKKENESLLQNTKKLHYQLQEKEQQLEICKKEYDFLKVAKTIEGSSKNKKDVKLKINALIRKIDTCIIQLNK